jgi:hypothetical protein
MAESKATVYLEPTQESGRALMLRRIEGSVVMLNHQAYMAGLGHRVAALADSRLLPLVEESPPE